MRYSIIHHEVREIFSLTIGEYLVCDSIHQLSYRKPYTKPLNQIGMFLGFSEKTVWRARDVLIEKQLIERVGEGYQATDKWVDEVTKKADKMSGLTGQNVRSGPDKMSGHYNSINKEGTGVLPDKTRHSEAPDEDVRVVGTDEDGNEMQTRQKGKGRNVAADRVASHFAKKAREYTGKQAVLGYGYSVVKGLIEKKHLTEKFLMGVVDEFFESCPPDDKAANPYVCFSAKNINRALIDA